MTTPITDMSPHHLHHETTTHFRSGSVFGAMARAAVTEYTPGREIKARLRNSLYQLIDTTAHYQDNNYQADTELLTNKLLRFRPRLIGALGVHNYLTDSTAQTPALENFYLFWALGSIQDDFIDTLPKYKPDEASLQERQRTIATSIFGDNRRFYRAAHHQLRQNLQNNYFGDKQQNYMTQKVTDWYRFLIAQEADVLEVPLHDMTYQSCRAYREEQNLHAGSALVALLNGEDCLNPERQRIESVVAQFSYLTQIIDDIADTAEDLIAERPSYAVGALLDHPAELDRMRCYVMENPHTKLTPYVFNRLAPESLRVLTETFGEYQTTLYALAGSRGLTTIASSLFKHFPYIRNVIFRINPKFANF